MSRPNDGGIHAGAVGTRVTLCACWEVCAALVLEPRHHGDANWWDEIVQELEGDTEGGWAVYAAGTPAEVVGSVVGREAVRGWAGWEGVDSWGWGGWRKGLGFVGAGLGGSTEGARRGRDSGKWNEAKRTAARRWGVKDLQSQIYESSDGFREFLWYCYVAIDIYNFNTDKWSRVMALKEVVFPVKSNSIYIPISKAWRGNCPPCPP